MNNAMLLHYVTGAWRSFRRSPLVAVINVIGLALGLACFVGAYAAVSYISGSDRQFATADHAYAITQRIYSPRNGFDTGATPGTSPIVARHLKADLPALAAVARADRLGELNAAVGGVSRRMPAVAADADFTKIFPFEMAGGSQSNPLSRPRSVVLTRDAAMRLFGNVDPIGKVVTLQKALDLTVTGVIARIPTPSQFDNSATGFLRFELLTSYDVSDELEVMAGGQRMADAAEAVQWARVTGPTYVLLPESGLSLATLRSKLATFPQDHVPKQRRSIASFQFDAIAVADVAKANLNAVLFHGSRLSVTWLLQLLAALVLGTACLNCANLAAASAAVKLREVGLRRALGAKNTQVIAQAFTEIAMLAVAALCLALLLIALVTGPLQRAVGIDLLQTLLSGANLWLVMIAALFSVCLLAGSYPALIVARIQPAGAVRQRMRGQSLFASRVLVALQFAVTSLLLIAVIVVYLQGSDLRRNGLGDSSAQTLVIQNGIFDDKINVETLRARLLAAPGVESFTVIDSVPWSSGTSTGAVSRTLDASAAFESPLFNTVAPGFEKALGLQLLAGRTFDKAYGEDFFPRGFPAFLESLDAAKIYNVVIDSELAANLGWVNPAAAIDQIVYMPFGRVGLRNATVRIIGVVEHRPLRLVGGTSANLFLSAPQVLGYPLLRISPRNIPATLRQIETIWNSAAAEPIQTRFLDDYFERSYQTFERIGRIVSGVAAFAFVISIMGLFGMALFVASRRRHEIGVRKTLGASVQQILTLLLRDFAKPVAIANLAMWPIAYLAANTYLGVFTHRMTLTPLPFVLSLIMTVLIAWLAVGSQAWRAANAKPATILRNE